MIIIIKLFFLVTTFQLLLSCKQKVEITNLDEALAIYYKTFEKPKSLLLEMKYDNPLNNNIEIINVKLLLNKEKGIVFYELLDSAKIRFVDNNTDAFIDYNLNKVFIAEENHTVLRNLWDANIFNLISFLDKKNSYLSFCKMYNCKLEFQVEEKIIRTSTESPMGSSIMFDSVFVYFNDDNFPDKIRTVTWMDNEFYHSLDIAISEVKDINFEKFGIQYEIPPAFQVEYLNLSRKEDLKINIKEGNSITEYLKDLKPRSKKSLFYVWGSWCAPCMTQIKNFNKNYPFNDYDLIGLQCEINDKVKSVEIKFENLENQCNVINEMGIVNFPTYILTDNNYKIISIANSYEEIIGHLEK